METSSPTTPGHPSADNQNIIVAVPKCSKVHNKEECPPPSSGNGPGQGGNQGGNGGGNGAASTPRTPLAATGDDQVLNVGVASFFLLAGVALLVLSTVMGRRGRLGRLGRLPRRT